MGKTLKYVSEFTFPSDKGYSGSAGKQMVKGYARGGSCGPMKKADGGAVDDPRRPLMDRKLGEYIDAINRERAMEMMERMINPTEGEMRAMLRQAAQRPISQGLRSPRAEMARERALMGKDAGYKKGGMATRKQYPTNRSEPMVAMKKGGHVSKKIMKKFDGGYIQDPASSNVPQGVSPLTQIANPQAQPALQNMIPPGNTSLSPTAMKRGGKVGAKLVKMADGGAMVIRDPSYSPNSAPRIQQQPSTNMPRIQQQPSTNMPRQPNPYTVDARPVTQGPGTGTPAGRPVGGGRPLAPGATPRPQMGQMTPQQASANAPRFANQSFYDKYMQQATGGRQPTMQPQTLPRPPTSLPPQTLPRPPTSLPPQQMGRPGTGMPQVSGGPVGGFGPQTSPPVVGGYSDPSTQVTANRGQRGTGMPQVSGGPVGGGRPGTGMPQISGGPVGGGRQIPQVEQPPSFNRSVGVQGTPTYKEQAQPSQQMGRPTMAKGGMLYSKKEVTAKNLLGEGKAPPLPHAKGSVNMAKGGMTSKQQAKVGQVMREFKAGDLHSGKNGPVVKSRKQAIAIGIAEARKAKK